MKEFRGKKVFFCLMLIKVPKNNQYAHLDLFQLIKVYQKRSEL